MAICAPSTRCSTTPAWLDLLAATGFAGATSVSGRSPATPPARRCSSLPSGHTGRARARAGRLARARRPRWRRRRWRRSRGGAGRASSCVAASQRCCSPPTAPRGRPRRVAPSTTRRRTSPAGPPAADRHAACAAPVGARARPRRRRSGSAALDAAPGAHRGRRRRRELWIVTGGAQPADGLVPDPAQAPSWGFGRVVALRAPGAVGRPDRPRPRRHPRSRRSGRARRDLATTTARIRWRSRAAGSASCRGSCAAPRRGRRRRRLALAIRRAATSSPAASAASACRSRAGWPSAAPRSIVLVGPDRPAAARRVGVARRRQPRGRAGGGDRGDRGAGRRVEVVAGDVADQAAMDALMARFGADLPPALRVVHAAAASASSSVAAMPRAAMAAMLRPKVAGTWRLHELTRRACRSTFSCCSRRRRRCGGHATSPTTQRRTSSSTRSPTTGTRRGSRRSASTGARGTRCASPRRRSREAVAGAGLRPMPSDQALHVLGTMLGDPDTVQRAVASVDWNVLRAIYEAPARPAVPVARRVTPRSPAAAGARAAPELAARLPPPRHPRAAESSSASCATRSPAPSGSSRPMRSTSTRACSRWAWTR